MFAADAAFFAERPGDGCKKGQVICCRLYVVMARQPIVRRTVELCGR
jgi:hypothetical protein